MSCGRLIEAVYGGGIIAMVKKILLCTLLLTLLFSISVSASFLSISNRYRKVSANINTTTYLDMDSIQLVRSDPPYYVIEGNIFKENYETSWIGKIKVKFFYDYRNKIMKAKFEMGLCMIKMVGICIRRLLIFHGKIFKRFSKRQ